MLQGAYVVGKHNRNTENVLGYVIAPQGPESYLIGVLAGSVVRGGAGLEKRSHYRKRGGLAPRHA